VIHGYVAVTALIGLYVWIVLGDGHSAPDGSSTRDVPPGELSRHVLRVIRIPAVWMQSLVIVCAYVGYKGFDNYSLFAVEAYGLDEVQAAQIVTLGSWVRPIGLILLIAAFFLVGAAYYPTAIRRVVRHPMLIGTMLWSISHLLTSGTTRGLVLFGGLGAWAVLEILMINRRDRVYTKPEAPGIRGELTGIFISGIIFKRVQTKFELPGIGHTVIVVVRIGIIAFAVAIRIQGLIRVSWKSILVIRHTVGVTVNRSNPIDRYNACIDIQQTFRISNC